MSKRIIEIVEYNPDWPAAYEREISDIKPLLADNLTACHHIGSTAVPGLAAKPVIDIIIEVASLSVLEQQTPLLAELGYEAKGENSIPGRRFFQKGGNQRSHHIHAFVCGDDHIIRHLAFRDYLRSDPDAAKQYAHVKRKAATECDNDSALYGQLKSTYINGIERLVL